VCTRRKKHGPERSGYATVWKRCKEIGQASNAQAEDRELKEWEEWQASQKPKASHRNWFIGSLTQGSQSSGQQIIC
jgi:hypothetical protein